MVWSCAELGRRSPRDNQVHFVSVRAATWQVTPPPPKGGVGLEGVNPAKHERRDPVQNLYLLLQNCGALTNTEGVPCDHQKIRSMPFFSSRQSTPVNAKQNTTELLFFPSQQRNVVSHHTQAQTHIFRVEAAALLRAKALSSVSSWSTSGPTIQYDMCSLPFFLRQRKSQRQRRRCSSHFPGMQQFERPSVSQSVSQSNSQPAG